MKKSNTIHIINLHHFLENNKLAQHCLEINQEQEPNMNFKIWTEDDPEIKEGIKSCKYENALNAYSCMAGIYLPYYIVYNYGGIYCEMDYEFLKKNYFYNLMQSTDLALEGAGDDNLSINNGRFVYSAYPKNETLSMGLKLYNSSLATSNDWATLQFENALKLNLTTKEFLNELKEKNLYLKNSTFNDPPILHYCGINYEDHLNICDISTYNKLCKTENYHEKYQKTIVYIDRSIYPDNVDMSHIDWYHQQIIFDKPLLQHYADTVRKYTDKKVSILDKIIQ